MKQLSKSKNQIQLYQNNLTWYVHVHVGYCQTPNPGQTWELTLLSQITTTTRTTPTQSTIATEEIKPDFQSYS